MKDKLTKKAPAIEHAIRQICGIDRTVALDGVCVMCGKEVTEDSFRDDLSKKEFTISGLCQSCQDEIFGG